MAGGGGGHWKRGSKTLKEMWQTSELQGRSVPLPVLQKGLPDETGIVYFSYTQQIFMGCLSGPGAILGNESRLLSHLIHKCPVVLVTWRVAGSWQGSEATASVSGEAT